MPTYDYQCQACGHTWEMFQSMNDAPTKSCPKCKKRKAKRLLGVGAGLIFKGTGFYETDYKTKTGSQKKEVQVMVIPDPQIPQNLPTPPNHRIKALVLPRTHPRPLLPQPRKNPKNLPVPRKPKNSFPDFLSDHGTDRTHSPR